MLTDTWAKNFPAAITICDAAGIILDMNEKSRSFFAKEGGGNLIGANVLDCHPEPARSKLKDMLANRTVSSYTIEKNGVQKLLYQAPWYQDGDYRGFVELIIELPLGLPHFLRR